MLARHRAGWPVNPDRCLSFVLGLPVKPGDILRGVIMNAHELSAIFADNIFTLPMGTVRIATLNGPLEVDGLMLGDWALNENAQGWTVTHRKSGYAGKNFPTPIEALIFLGIMLGAGLLELPDEITTDTFNAIPGIRSIAERLKAADKVLDSWDLDLDYNETEV